MDEEFVQRYSWLLMTIALFVVEFLLNGFFCTCSLRSSNPARSGMPVLLLNIWLTNALDGGLLFSGRVAAHVLQVDTGYNGTSELIHNEDRGFKDSWLITLHLGIPLKIATHALSNLLGLAICVDIGFLSDQPGFKPQVGRAVMNQRRAVDYAGLSWIIALFLMCHPLVLSFVDTTAFLVVLYTWTVYMALATLIIIGLVLSVCCRRQLRHPEEHEDMLDSNPEPCSSDGSQVTHRTKALAILLQLVLVLGMMLPWPLFETLHLHRSTRDAVVKNLKKQFSNSKNFGVFYQILRLLPLVFYVVQPACLLLFPEARDRLPTRNARIRKRVKIGQTRAQFRPLTRDHDHGRDQGELSEIESVL